jgi:hypothetical protein
MSLTMSQILNSYGGLTNLSALLAKAAVTQHKPV